MKSARETIQEDASFLDRLLCRLFGCTELKDEAWHYGWCIRCGKPVRR